MKSIGVHESASRGRVGLEPKISDRVESASKMAAVNGEKVDDSIKEKSKVWTHDQELTLLQNVEKHLESAGGSKDIYIKDIKWSEIVFEDFNEDDVHKRWNALTSKVRKMRTAKEILEDAKQKVADKSNKESRKRKRDDKYTGLPKMPLTSYIIFCNEKRQQLAKKYSNLNNNELMTKLAKKWRKLSEEKKKKYHDIYLENRKKFDQDITQYFIEHYPDEKKPKTALDLWSDSKKKEMKKDHPEMSEKKMKKKINKYWDKMEDDEREEWEKKSKTEVARYIKRMKKMDKV